GIVRNTHLVGDIMLDILNWAREGEAWKGSVILEKLQLKQKGFFLCTVHRSENTDEISRLSGILMALNALEQTVVFPVHPRTRKIISEGNFSLKPHVQLIEPVGYLDMVRLVAAAQTVLTDSGGLQKEAYWLGVPCVTLREETEWVETVQAGWNRLTGAIPNQIVDAVRNFDAPTHRPDLYGDGSTAVQCSASLK
ncbi:MAG: UDP-N-acetylglucosamine 2-epimerase, partial [Terriglobia bacterium]